MAASMIRQTDSHARQLVQKLWNFCNLLRDDGLSYGDYVEQLTFLLFLKMADEQSRPRSRACGFRHDDHVQSLRRKRA